jgi:hypothetical protein
MWDAPPWRLTREYCVLMGVGCGAPAYRQASRRMNLRTGPTDEWFRGRAGAWGQRRTRYRFRTSPHCKRRSPPDLSVPLKARGLKEVDV